MRVELENPNTWLKSVESTDGYIAETTTEGELVENATFAVYGSERIVRISPECLDNKKSRRKLIHSLKKVGVDTRVLF